MRIAIAAALTTGALLLSACASGTTAGSGASSTAVDPAATTAAVAAAQTSLAPYVTAATQPNAWNGPTSAPTPKAGEKVTIIAQMNATGAALPAQAMQEAAQKLGWTTNIVDNQGRADLKLSAINAAVDEKVDAIILVFTDPSIVASGIQRAQAAGIPLITFGIPKDTGFGIPDVHSDYAVQGKTLANYLVVASAGKLNLLLEEASDEYAITNGHDPAVRSVVQDPVACPGCTVTTNQYVLANFVDPTSGPAAQASATLQSNPSINWVTCFDACLFQVISAVDRAGLANQVGAAGFGCTPENLQYILDGHIEKACVADPMQFQGWATIDNVNRLLNGQKTFDYTSAVPVAVFDQTTIQSLSPAVQADMLKNGWSGNVDFRAQFSKIWGVN